jgi:hypothetical protein
MNVTAIGPLPVGSVVWQRHANRVLTVVCKATFVLQPGESPLAEEQEALNPEDAYLEDDPGRSLQAPSDLVPFKARGDVVLVGYAFAPRAEPVRSLVVRLVVGELDKSVEVFGDRAWTMDGALREAARFTRLALRYERAAGGPETANPIGVSPDASPDAYGNVPLPNLQPVGFVPSRRGELVPPIGFGPLSGTWPGRREKLGRLTVPPEQWDLAPLPTDLEPAYFNCAPRDQQVERLRDNERLVLENLHPQHPRLVTNLPGVRPRAFADRGDGPQEIAMVADTLWIDTGHGACTLTWRGYVESPTVGGNVVVAMEGPGRPLPWAEVQSAARGEGKRRTVETMPFIDKRVVTAVDAGLPFAPGSRGRTPSGSMRVADMAPSSSRDEPPPSSSTGIDARRTGDGLPFAKPARSAEPPPAPYGDPPPPGAAAPAWLQGRSTPLPPPSPIVPASAIVPAPLAPPLVPPAPMVHSPWAGGASLGASAVVAAPLPVLAARPGGGAGLPGSAAAASDAAADVPARPPASRPQPAVAPASDKGPRAFADRGDVLDLLWYEEARVPRIRAWWEELVTDLDFEASDPRRDLGAEDPEKARGRHNVFGIMSDGAVVDPSGVSRVIAEAINARGRFTPPLALVGGELRFPFDEVETLKATLVAMTPLAGSDKRLKESIDSLTELLKTPYLQGASGVVEKLTREIRDQFREANRALPAGYLDAHVERLLLEQRRYSIRKVFGGEFIRALLGAPGGDGGRGSSAEAPLPVYLPKALDQTLPMLVVMKVRLIAEAHLQQDPYDTSPYALRAVALGRSFQLDGR